MPNSETPNPLIGKIIYPSIIGGSEVKPKSPKAMMNAHRIFAIYDQIVYLKPLCWKSDEAHFLRVISFEDLETAWIISK